MTDLLEPAVETRPDPLDQPPVEGEPKPQAAGSPGAHVAGALPGHWVLAALLVGAGAIHMAMVPSHFGESALDGSGFLVAGWAQLGLAVLVVRRPSRLTLWATIGVSVGLIFMWAVSRTVGLPVGGHAGGTEDLAVVDGLCAALEVLAVVLAACLLARPASWLVRSSAVAFAGGIIALVIATGAIASPAARDHAAGGHAHGEEAGAAGGHAHGGEAADDLGFSALANGQMGSHEHPGEEGAPAETEITPADSATLATQLSLTAPLVESYPTLGDARAGGYVQQGPFSPGLGLHMGGPIGMNTDGDMDPQDIARPTLIYDGLEDDAPLAGFMYMAYQDTEPEGFAGPLDRWHYHTSVCLVIGSGGIETPFGADLTGVTDAMCEAEGGRMIDFTGYMVHVWTVPGYESELGTFSDLNPNITCSDGTYYVVDTADIGSADSTCVDAA